MTYNRKHVIVLIVLLAGLTLGFYGSQASGRAEALQSGSDSLSLNLASNMQSGIEQVSKDGCSLLDDPTARGLMSGAFERKLLIQCGRAGELGGVQNPLSASPADLGLDVLVNDPSGDSGPSRTQSETSLALSDAGILCSGYNDSYHGVTQGTGYTGFSSSTDGAASWTDHGPVLAGPGLAFGDPAVAWKKANDTFYIASLHTDGLGLWNLGAACDTVSWVTNIHVGSGDDKELMAIDNNLASPFYGRMYVAWTDFNAGSSIVVSHSDDGISWSSPVTVSNPGTDVQGAWPAVGPNGDVYVAWVRWNPYPGGPIDIEVTRSTNGGSTFSLVSNPLTGAVNPRDENATNNCGRPALNGDIRYLPSPQIVVDGNGYLHVVYSYDPDGYNNGDVVNVYYRRSTNNGASWEPEVQLNDDGTLRDQFFPALTVNPSGIVGAFWYDRRLDAGNYLFDYFQAVSYDNGSTFQINARVSDVSSPVVLDPNLATCYHGDYDTSTSDLTRLYIQWSDDRGGTPDVWSDTELVGVDLGHLDGTVSDANTSDPIEGALVTADRQGGGAWSRLTDASGYYTMTLLADFYNVTAQAFGYWSFTVLDVEIITDQITTVNFSLPPLPIYTISGTVTEAGTGIPLLAEIEILDTPIPPVLSDPSTGFYSIQVPLGDYTMRVSASLHQPEERDISADQNQTQDFALLPLPCILLVDDDNNNPDVLSYYTNALDNLGYDYNVFDVGGAGGNGPSLEELQGYSIVIWFSGDKYGDSAGPNGTDEANLAAYLDGGGKLFLSSQDYLYDFGLTPFGQNYLGIGTYFDDTGNASTKYGLAGDPIGDGLGPYPLSYPANFEDYGDIVNAAPGASVAFRSSAGGGNNLDVDKDGGGWQTVFFGTSWVAVANANAANGEQLLGRIIDWFGGCEQFPLIELNKTVGTDANACATTDSLEVATGSEVTYCYEVTNTGSATLSLHDLVDSQLGVILEDFPYTLLPDESTFITQTATILTDTVNTATWTAYVSAGGEFSEASDSASVTVLAPEIELNKTVGTDPNACATTDSLEVAAGSQVTYCYEVTNTGEATFSLHDLVDSQLGVILEDFPYMLEPGATTFFTQTATILTDTVNTATFTSYVEEGGVSAEASDSASVTVLAPEIELSKTVGTDPNTCAATDSLEVPAGSEVTYCYEVTNTGEVTFSLHDLVDSQLGVLLEDYAYDLLPGESLVITETTTILTDTVNTATITSYVDEGGVSAEASDSATVTIVLPGEEYVIYLPIVFK